jgi:tRNA(Arg) A34 adenosine deaminase TadA
MHSSTKPSGGNGNFAAIFQKMDLRKISFMREALRLAAENLDARNGGPFGCVIVKGGEIIATGYNEVLTSNDPTCHAEIVAIRKACVNLGTHQLEGCEIYSSCEPCPMCLGAIYWARPDRFYFSASRYDAAAAGFDDAHIYDEIVLDPPGRVIPGEQLLEEEGATIIHKWKDLNMKIKY